MEKKKRCEFCQEWFTPHPFSPHQRGCAKPACRKQRKAAAGKRWWGKNPDYGKSRRQKIRVWARNYPNYWRQYRKNHPDYAGRDNHRRRAAHKKARTAAKQDAATQVYVETLNSIVDTNPISAAKQDTAHGRINALLKCLIWKETAAKQDAVAGFLCRAP